MTRRIIRKENSVGKLVISLAALMAVLAASGHAMAADEHMLAWDNFALRVLNVIIFIGIIWYAAGALIRKFFVGHREAVAREMAELERLKKEAGEHLADVEHRVAGVEQECEKLLADGRAQAESLKAAILADAERQAALILEQARRSAEQEGKSESDAIRAGLADEIVKAMEQGLLKRLGSAEHQKLIDKSLTKVVLQ